MINTVKLDIETVRHVRCACQMHAVGREMHAVGHVKNMQKDMSDACSSHCWDTYCTCDMADNDDIHTQTSSHDDFSHDNKDFFIASDKRMRPVINWMLMDAKL